MEVAILSLFSISLSLSLFSIRQFHCLASCEQKFTLLKILVIIYIYMNYNRGSAQELGKPISHAYEN